MTIRNLSNTSSPSILENSVDISTNASGISTVAANVATNTSDITAIESNATILTGRVTANETDLLGKQNELTSASALSLRSLDFPDVVAAGNITLPGNAVLKSGSLDAKIQNGNIVDFTSIQNTLLTNITLGNT